MALSGSFTGSTANARIEPKIVWSATQDIAGNYSDVTATLYYSRTNSGYTTSGTWSGGISINGVRTSGSKSLTITYNSNTEALTATTRVYHNTDGTKSIHISADGGMSVGSLTSTSCSSDVTLDQIPRQATLTLASNFDDKHNPTIWYSNPAGDAVTALAACISFTGAIDDIPYRAIPKTEDHYTFPLTDAEKTTLYKGTLSNSTSRNVIFYVRTDLGGSSYYSTITKTFTVTDCDPTLNPTVIDTKSSSIALTGNANTIIKNYNKVKVSFNATTKKEASISSTEITYGDRVFYSSTGDASELNNVDSGTFVCKVTDNHGLSASKTVVANMIDYVPLTCNSSYNTELIDGSNLNVTLNINGSYFNGSFGKVKNSLTIKYRYKINNGAYQDTWTTISTTPTISNGEYSVKHTITGLDYQNTYTIQVKAADAIYNDTAEPAKQASHVIKVLPVFDWSETDFNFNVPVIGKEGFIADVSSTNKYESNSDQNETAINAWLDAQLSSMPNDSRKDVCISCYPAIHGNTYIATLYKHDSGYAVLNGVSYNNHRMHKIKSNGTWEPARLGQTILWTGSHYMSSNQTAYLSETISSQPNGIVLWFCEYDSATSEVRHSNTTHHFIPKSAIANVGTGYGHCFTMTGPWFNAFKYLYVYDDKLVGNDLNSQVVTVDGITNRNNQYILRRIYGV